MGELLGLGVTHFPPLGAREARPVALPQALRDPDLPVPLRTPDAWPAAMRAEWGDDGGAAAGERHRAAVVDALRDARAALDAFAPDFVLVWGDDQYENFREDCIPPFCLLAYEQHTFQPWQHGPVRQNWWDEPADTTLSVAGHRAGARYLASGLLAADFDVAYAYQPLHRDLGHAFANTVLYLDWDRRGFPHPLVPFAVNCYGRRVIAYRGFMGRLADDTAPEALDPPSPSPRRCFALGAACARVLRASPWRVALVASSSWSHAFLTRKHHFLYPDVAADRRLYEALVAGDYAAWERVTLDEIEASGQQELLNWFCLVGSMAELGYRTRDAVFLESHVMNSNKVVATFTA